MIQLKGRQAGLLRCVIPDDTSEKQMFEELSSIIAQSGNVLGGCKVVMDMQARVFSPSLAQKIWKSFIEPSGCVVVSWICSDQQTKDRLESLGLRVGEYKEKKTEPEKLAEVQTSGLLHVGNLRGGQKLTHRGDIIILGNVNKGAEVYAEGHIVVLGRLSGLVHAGCEGDETASITARALETEQVRIAAKAGILDKTYDMWGKPAAVTINNNELFIAEWPSI